MYYFVISEREKRASEGVVTIKIIGSGKKYPKQWRKYLGSGEIKSELVQFILKEWSGQKYKSLIGNRHLFSAVELKCFCVFLWLMIKFCVKKFQTRRSWYKAAFTYQACCRQQTNCGHNQVARYRCCNPCLSFQ